MPNVLEIRAGELTLATLRAIYEQPVALRLSAYDRGRIAVASSLVDKIIALAAPLFQVFDFFKFERAIYEDLVNSFVAGRVA